MVEINFTIIIQAINFLILVFVLKRIFWKPIMRHLDRRDSLIQRRKSEINRLNAEADKLQEEYSTKIRNARIEAIKIRDGLIMEGRIKRGKLISEAMNKAEQIVSEGEKRLAEEVKSALQAVTDDDIERLAEAAVARIVSQASR